MKGGSLVLVWIAAFSTVVLGTSSRTLDCGFHWAENAAFVDDACALLVSELDLGELVKITFNGSDYERTVVDLAPSHFARVLGVVVDAANATVYFVAVGGSCSVSELEGSCVYGIGSKLDGPPWEVARVPAVGNGLAHDADSGTLYVACEALMVPGLATVWAVHPLDGAVERVLDDGFGYDGARVAPMRSLSGGTEPNLLVVTEVLEARLVLLPLAENGSAAGAPWRVQVSGARSIDDFMLTDLRPGSPPSAVLLGADYVGGAVFSSAPFALSPSVTTVVAARTLAEFDFPTSVRPATDAACPGFNDRPGRVIATQGASLVFADPPIRCVYFVDA